MDGWNTRFLLGFDLFSGANWLVSGRVFRVIGPYLSQNHGIPAGFFGRHPAPLGMHKTL